MTESQEGSHALALDGIDDWVQFNDIASKIEGSWSFAAWVKAPAKTWQRCILGINTQRGNNKLIIFIGGGSGANELGLFDSTRWEADTNTIVADGQWHHLAYTRSGNVGTLYVDGLAKATHAASYTLASTDQWSLGQEFDSTVMSDYFNGSIDDVRFYNFALTPDAVNELSVVDLR